MIGGSENMRSKLIQIPKHLIVFVSFCEEEDKCMQCVGFMRQKKKFPGSKH
jgi:hypothetical protein